MFGSNIMHKIFAFAISILCALGQATLIRDSESGETVRTGAAVRYAVETLGNDAQVVVTVADGEVVEGTISSISANRFRLAKGGNLNAVDINYEDVQKVERQPLNSGGSQATGSSRTREPFEQVIDSAS